MLQSTRSGLRVFTTVLSFFAVAVVLTGATITVANYLQTRQAALDVASDALETTVRRMTEQRIAFFNPVRLLVGFFSEDPRVIAGMGEVGAMLLPSLNALEQNPQISGVYAGYENGDFFQVLQFSDREQDTIAALGGPPQSRFALQTIKRDDGGKRIETWSFLDATRQVVHYFTREEPSYDPRQRGWYIQAMAEPGVMGRTAPYVYAVTPQVGLTVQRSFAGPIGGVAAADVTLDRLSGLFRNVQQNPQRRALAFERDGRLIASPDPDQVLKRIGSGTDLQLAPADLDDVDDPVIAAVAKHFAESGPFDLDSIDVGGEEFLASVVQQEEVGGRHHYILYAAPRSDFEGSLAGAATRVILPGLLVILLVLPLIVYLARTISRAQVALTLEYARVQAIIDTVPNPVFYKGADSRFIGCNIAYEECFNVKRADFIGKRVLDLMYLPEEDRLAYQAEDEELIRTAGARRREMAMPFADGRVHQTLYCVSGFRREDGAPGGLVGTFVDIDDQKQAQRAMAAAKELAEAATKAKGEFLASMSHEIRTPMNGITGMADLLAHTALDDEQKHMLRTIRESGNALITVINDILDFSKIEAGRLDLEDVSMSVADALEGVAGTLTPNATKKAIAIHTFVDPAIPQAMRGDPVRLRQILFNLIGNAVKFSDRKDVIVRALPLSREGDSLHIRFEVIDRGIGISQENQAKLFQAFSQAESSTTRKFGGTGLGLAICKRLAELMSGRIGVDSAEGRGSTFWVEAPFRIAEESRATEAMRDLRGVRLLLVGSPEPRHGALAAYLDHWGAELAAVADENAAAAALEESDGTKAAFDAIVLDLGLDNARHKAATERLRAAQIGLKRKLPLVLLENLQQRRDRIQGNDVVAVDANPLVRYRFVSAVAVAVGRASPEIRHDEDAAPVVRKAAPTVDRALAAGQLILLAEDNPTNQDVIRRQLNALGYACEIVGNGALALDAWKTGRYALLLTDCHMPEMDGYELAAALRKTESGSGRRAPIVAITANVVQGEAERCIAAGMDDYLSKPVAMPALQAALRKWMPGASGAETGRNEEAAPPPAATPPAAAASAGQNGGPPVNDRAIKEMFGDDEETFREILRGFVDPSQEIVRDIQAALASRNAENVKAAAHKLKSSARSIGADSLADLCAALEAAGKARDWDRIESLAPQARQRMAEVVDYIGRL